MLSHTKPALIDRFGREIRYLRMSITDRCDLRCVYCMAEDMTFLPRSEVLTLEELEQLAQVFVSLGVQKIRLTGGEPLVRQGVVSLVAKLSAIQGLKELCMTTNGTRLAEFAEPLKAAGLTRLNISLDTLSEDKFRTMTRHGRLASVLEGIDAAISAGFEKTKLNCVALKHYNADEAGQLVEFAMSRNLDISFIEEMPMGEVTSHGRVAEYISSDELREQLASQFTLTPSAEQSGGPARYWALPGSASKVGFISPHSHNFCGSCNRVRLTATGRLLLCLGQEHSKDLRHVLRSRVGGEQDLAAAIVDAMQIKPEAHSFDVESSDVQVVRFMNMTGG
ncbi:GTP 3',8-cyclase MoaA [Gilvimarinus sp. SDUM040013]|uniref:GTP 3',8-cyclase n=1 Tax=Gilvimarinus gilvus TaxID=3058038 RepID=A0ABU4S141_9GAMM|nr:GTP 3',8-cyclase MoaA [Gilvimarinus sp. SDUM040013]MDO3388653.1 GTP 3',8-cyclase MoaA [Gilvimarinus sp. SDUM040013]MDX6849548.1 GTP 3',8-cyclase MoaA [Gilvimarinus sp. SDUM040013]